MATTAELLAHLSESDMERSPASSFAPGLIGDIDDGVRLERQYRNKLFNTLSGDPKTRAELTNRITGTPGSNDEVEGYVKKPMYEELEKIPLNDQLRLMQDHFEEIKTSPQSKLTPKEQYMQQLAIGQRYV